MGGTVTGGVGRVVDEVGGYTILDGGRTVCGMGIRGASPDDDDEEETAPP